jgi:hypothetical protein
MAMWILWTVVGIALIFSVLIDAFETILQPRRVTHRYRFARLFYRTSWRLWRRIARRIPAGKKREAFLSVFAPVSLLALIGNWLIGLILGFTLVHWSLGSVHRAQDEVTFLTYLYMSGETLFTLGYGDFTPSTTIGRMLSVAEAGLGFAFLAVVISYLPVLQQAFSLREVTISMMDARAGSPPSAARFLTRMARSGNVARIDSMLAEWERWAAELLESNLSFPLLSYYRSQHDNQSWLAALTSMLDTCTVLMVEVKGINTYQAQLTFAMARHAAVDLALVLKTPPVAPDADRLPPDRRQRMQEMLRNAGLTLHDGAEVDAKMAQLRETYEPFVNALAGRFMFSLPPFISEGTAIDNWQTSAWTRRMPGIGALPTGDDPDGHFD